MYFLFGVLKEIQHQFSDNGIIKDEIQYYPLVHRVFEIKIIRFFSSSFHILTILFNSLYPNLLDPLKWTGWPELDSTGKIWDDNWNIIVTLLCLMSR